MAEKVLISRTGRTQVCIESAFGTGSSWVDVHPTSGELVRMKEKIARGEERTRKFAHQRSIQGLLSWTAKLSFELRAQAEGLDAGATPETPANLLLLKGLWGGEHKAAGSTVASATTTTVTLASGHGTRFPKGSYGAVPISGELAWFEVIDNDGADEITVYPTLPGTPSTSAKVFNSNCYYPTQSNAQSVGVRHAKLNHASPSDDAQQWTQLGGTGDASIILEEGKLAMLEYDLRGKPWSGPSNAPGLIPAPDPEETQGQPHLIRNATVLFQPLATTTRVHCPLRKLSLKFNGGMIHKPDHGNVENCSGVERVGDDYIFASGEFTKLYDPTFDGYYESETDLTFMHVTKFGTGATAGFLIVHVPTLFLDQKPPTPDDGGLVVQTHTWEALEDGLVVDPDTDLARAPVRVALIRGT